MLSHPVRPVIWVWAGSSKAVADLYAGPRLSAGSTRDPTCNCEALPRCVIVKTPPSNRAGRSSLTGMSER